MVGPFFSKEDEGQIVEAIRTAERLTTGEIQVHLRKKCSRDPKIEAQRLFKKLRLDRTKEKNAVLLFIALESHQLVIVGDSGIHQRVRPYFWDQTRDLMLGFFKKNEIKKGLLAGIWSVGEQLQLYFPAKLGDTNQLPDTVTED